MPERKRKRKHTLTVCRSQALQAENAGGIGLGPCDVYVIGYRRCVKFDVSEEVKTKKRKPSQ